MCDIRLSPRLKLSLVFYVFLRSVKWFGTDVSGLRIGPIFKSKLMRWEKLWNLGGLGLRGLLNYEKKILTKLQGGSSMTGTICV